MTQHLCFSISRGTEISDSVLILVWLLVNCVTLELRSPIVVGGGGEIWNIGLMA